MIPGTYTPDTHDPRAQGEPLDAYGARLLRFVLDTRSTSSLSEADLELAERAGQWAMATLPKELSQVDACVAARITETRHHLLAVLAERRRRKMGLVELFAKLEVQSPEPPTTEPPAPTDDHNAVVVRALRNALLILMDGAGGDERPDGGRKTPLVPPSPNKPSGGYADF